MKRIETMTELFAHLITCNEPDKSFNEVWDFYFSKLPIGFMSYNEVLKWLEEEVEENGK